MLQTTETSAKHRNTSIFQHQQQQTKNGALREHINFAFRNINKITPPLISKYGKEAKTLDLSHNQFQDLSSLYGFEHVETLILDHNEITCNVSFPSLPSLKMLSLNANKISNLSVFVRNLSSSLPSLKYLSLMKNEAAPSYFNGGSLQQYQDYRLFVISHFAALEVLDDQKVKDDERKQAYSIYGRRWKLKHARTRSRALSNK